MAAPTTSTFVDLIPQGWIREYVCAMQAVENEMPEEFHFLAACAVVGQLLGLRCYATINKGIRIYPNVNILLLSPAGQCRRGEGTKITIDIARRAGTHILEGKATPEGLIDELMEFGDVLLYAEELSMLLTKQDYQRPLIPLLTKLLLHGSGECDLRTRGLGRLTLPRINLTALFTSAPDWFMTTIPQEAFGGGMMSRFIVCCLSKRSVFKIDICSDDDDEAFDLRKHLADKLMEVSTVEGRFQGTIDAQMWIEKWYLSNENAVITDDRLLPHRNRKPANLLRIAMILGASCGESRLTKPLLENALAILDYLEPTLSSLFGMTDAIVSDLNNVEAKIVAKIAALGKVEHIEIARLFSPLFRYGVKELRTCLNGLSEKGLIEPYFLNGASQYSWPPTGWGLTPRQEKLDEQAYLQPTS